ncbi:DUF3272 family protein [Streptococcus dentapri]|uniref:DUF3272 family protein n=1 Tax=Streptococcus dentapri TaxID=573564 RepID=A0ABV8D210_9STRE
MNRLQFIVMALWCAVESYFFSSALMSGSYILAAFWAFLLLRNLQNAYLADRLLKELLKSLPKSPKKKD